MQEQSPHFGNNFLQFLILQMTLSYLVLDMKWSGFTKFFTHTPLTDVGFVRTGKIRDLTKLKDPEKKGSFIQSGQVTNPIFLILQVQK